MRVAVRGFLLLLLLAYGVAIAMGHVADRLLLLPTTNSIPIAGAATRATLPFEGGTLELMVARTPPAPSGAPVRAFVLVFHGNASRAEDALALAHERWRDWPAELWALNYPGFGRSSGPARLDRIGPAALAGYDAIAARAAGTPIVVDGNSIGTTAALHVAANRPCAGVVLQSPPPLRRLILQKFGWWNLWLLAGPVALQVPSALDSVANARAVTAPGIFITGSADTLVPPRYQEYVIEAYAGPKRRIALVGKGHNDVIESSAERREFRDAVEAMLGR